MPLAFIGGIEIFWILIVGLLLFGGQLPDMAKEAGKVFFRAKRSLEEIRKESGIDDAIRDIEREARTVEREARDFAAEAKAAASDVPDWRQVGVDPAAGPAGLEPAEDCESVEAVEKEAPENENAPQGADSQQADTKAGQEPEKPLD